MNNLRQHKTRAVLYVIRQDRTDKILEFCVNLPVVQRLKVCYAISAIKTQCLDFHIVVAPSGMAYLYLNGYEIAVMHPEGDDGWRNITWKQLKELFPHEYSVAYERYGKQGETSS